VKPYAFHPKANEEYTHAARFYADIDPELGGRFYDQIERLILDIRRQPQLYPLFDSPVRRHFDSVFPFAILYVDQPGQVLVVAVMHMKRRPGYWRERLR
jgi:plasmid stabilization system protein ParE